MGSSPAETLQTIVAEVPSSKVSCPKLMGTSLGGSEIHWKINIFL